MIRIVRIKDIFVYPIFKNGKTALEHYADQNNSKWLLNEQCGRADTVTVFLRNPRERFVSGVHSFIEFERRKHKDIDYQNMLHNIDIGESVNEHFMEQYEWIRKLAEYFTGILTINTVNQLRQLIPNRESPKIPKITPEQRSAISKIKYDMRHDEILFDQYIGKQIPIKQLMRDIDHAVS